MNPPQNSPATNFAAKAFQLLGPLLALLVILLLVIALDKAFGSGNFSSLRNARNVATQKCVIAVAALGMTVVVISGGIDLSCGTAIALSATVLAYGLREDAGCVLFRGGSYESVVQRLKDAEQRLASARQNAEVDPEEISRWETIVADQRARLIPIVQDKLKLIPESDKRHGILKSQLDQLQQAGAAPMLSLDSVPIAPSTVLLALVMGIGTGTFCGLLNGALISMLRVVPFIITLGTMSIFLGAAKWLGDDTTIRLVPEDQIPHFLQGMLVPNTPKYHFAGMPLGLWVLLIAAVALAIVLKFSVFGRHVFALGSNEQTARLCGINVPVNKLAVYSLGGFFIGLAGMMQFCLLGQGNPTSAQEHTLPIIAAVVIGGASLNGGRGTVLGTLAGAGITAVILSGGNQLGLKQSMQDIFLGVVIIGAACIDQLRQRMSR